MSFFYESVKFSSCAVLDLYPNAVSHLLKAFHSESNELSSVGLKKKNQKRSFISRHLKNNFEGVEDKNKKF